MTNLPPDRVISFKRRQPTDMLPGTVNVIPNNYSSTGIIRINTASLNGCGRSLPLLESLHRRRLSEKGHQLLQSSSSDLSISEDEINCVKHMQYCGRKKRIHTAYELTEYDAIEKFTTLRKRLNWLRHSNKLCDVTVQCGKSHINFPAHCGVLVTGSKLCSELIDSAIQLMDDDRIKVAQSSCTGESSPRESLLNSVMVPAVKTQGAEAYFVQFGDARNARKCNSLSWINLSPLVTGSRRKVGISSKHIFPFTSRSADACRFETKVDESDDTLQTQSASAIYTSTQESDGSSVNSLSYAVRTALQQLGTFHVDYVADEKKYVVLSPKNDTLTTTTSTDVSYSDAIISGEDCSATFVCEAASDDLEMNDVDRINNLNEKLVININGIDDPVIFELLLEYIYTGVFTDLKTLPVHKLQKVQDIARLLKMEEVDIFSPELMRQVITKENVTQLWKLAEERKDDALKNVIHEYIAKCTTDRGMLNAGMILPPERRKTEVVAFTKTQMKQSRRETLRALLEWVNQFPEHRKRFLPCILPRLSSKTDRTDCVEEFLKSDSNVQHLAPGLLKHLRGRYLLRNKRSSCDNPVCRAAMPDYILCQRKTAALNKRHLSKPWHRPISRLLQEKKPPPLPDPIRLVMVVTDPSTNTLRDLTDAETTFDYEENNQPALFSTTSPCVTHRLEERISPASYKAKVPSIVVLGRQTTTKTLFSIKFDHFGRIREETDLHPALTEDTPGLTLASYYNFPIVVGKKFGFMPVVKSLIYETTPIDCFASASELQLPSMTFSRRSFKIFTAGATVYFCGGESSSQGYLGDVESYNFESQDGRWNKNPSMRYKRAGHSMVCTNDRHAVVVGGGTNRCEIFSLITERWSEIAALPWKFQHCDVHAFIVDADIVAMSSFQPVCIYVLELYRNVWKQHRLTGRPPSEVISITVCLGTVYAISNKRLHFFKMTEKEWYPFTKIPRPNFEPLFLSSWEVSVVPDETVSLTQ